MIKTAGSVEEYRKLAYAKIKANWSEKDAERNKLSQRKRRAEKGDDVRKYQREYHRKYYQENKEALREYNRKRKQAERQEKQNEAV